MDATLNEEEKHPTGLVMGFGTTHRCPPMSVLRCDVVVVGGGPAGLATAVALRRMDHTVTVLERTDYLAPRVGEHIPPGAKTVLASLGLADVIASERHAACPGIRSVWGSDEPQDRDYPFHVAGEGFNPSRPEFDRDFAALAGRAGATVLTRARLTHLSRAGGLWDLSAQHAGGPAEIRCRVVVDATGRAASVAKRLGALPIVYDELVGIVGNVAVAKRGNHLVLIEALPDGCWYSAGLADDRVIATFLTDPERTETSRAARSDFWHARLRAARRRPNVPAPSTGQAICRFGPHECSGSMRQPARAGSQSAMQR